MASERIKAERRALALQRLQDAKTEIAGRLGLGAQSPATPVNNRDPELAQIQQAEDVADFLESLIGGFTDLNRERLEALDRVKELEVELGAGTKKAKAKK